VVKASIYLKAGREPIEFKDLPPALSRAILNQAKTKKWVEFEMGGDVALIRSSEIAAILVDASVPVTDVPGKC
jgi:hypothetical protein